MELSKRLCAVARLVIEGASVVDVGTDHGYIPIYLMEHGVASKVIAADINRGPLKRAQLHIMGHKNIADRIETRLSDGLKEIKPYEVDTMIAAGMGGALIIRILSQSEAVVSSLSNLILQPQSEMERVRRYLAANQLCIVEEDMVLEDGKYYPMMKVVHAEAELYSDVDYIYGKKLLETKHPILKEYLQQELRIKKEIVMHLEHADTSGAKERKEAIQKELAFILEALLGMDS